MSVNLQKGQKVDLTKGNTGLKRVMVGLGWAEAEAPQQKGFLAGLFGGGDQKEEYDLDAMAFLLNKDGQIASKGDVIFYNNLNHASGCVKHQGDDLVGGGGGDDEQIMIDLSNLPQQYDRIVVLVSIYEATEKRQHFGIITRSHIRLLDADTNKELCIYNLSENYSGMTALIFGELYRHENEWKFSAVGQPLQQWSVAVLAERYGLNRSNWS